MTPLPQEYRTVPLTKGFVALIDAADYELISGYSWCVDVRPNGLCYANTSLAGPNRKTLRMHQLILPGKGERDHRNGDGLDNRRSNLRFATRTQNLHNRRKKRSATYKGVTYQPRLISRPWQVRVGYRHIGYFATAEEAALAFNRVALAERGEFARLNEVAV